MGFIRWAFSGFIKEGKEAKSLAGLIIGTILGYIVMAIFAVVVAVISFFCGFIPVLGWIISIICWVVLIIVAICFLYSIPGKVVSFLTYFKVIK